jgi:GNAT superfamily N-acetyltransferase
MTNRDLKRVHHSHHQYSDTLKYISSINAQFSSKHIPRYSSRADPTMTAPPTYLILPIPHTSPRLRALVEKYKATKLAAIRTDPTGFLVSHADELLHPFSVWESRLAAPSTMLICVAVAASEDTKTDEEVLLEGQWVGMAMLRGPLPWTSYYLPGSGQPVPQDPQKEAYWYLCTLFTAPAHRGRGLAKRIINGAVDIARCRTEDMGGEMLRARMKLFFDPRRDLLRGFYNALGFNEVGRVTLREGFEANGDAEMLPRDTMGSEELRARWETRYGAVMEKIVVV